MKVAHLCQHKTRFILQYWKKVPMRFFSYTVAKLFLLPAALSLSDEGFAYDRIRTCGTELNRVLDLLLNRLDSAAMAHGEFTINLSKRHSSQRTTYFF